MHALNLLVLRCVDVEKTRPFYEALGYSFAKHRHGTGPEHCAHEAAGGVLELYPSSEANPADRVGLGFVYGDLPALVFHLAELGLDPGPVQEQPWGTTFVVRDPDGRRVEVQAIAGA